MAIDLTNEAGEGFDWQRKPNGSTRASDHGVRAIDACPYLNTSPAAMAWHLGRHLAKGGFARPDSGRDAIHVLTSRGDSFRVVLYEEGSPVNDTASRFHWNNDNTFTELP